ncbi:MAG TPA: hypothetical protein VFP40_12400, partial [Terriglobales bacterium]|nr:hypothetical protein [Terriglobales bacterium]
MKDYFGGMMAFMGGGLSSEKELGAEPYVVNLELNEWKSLPPGSYRLRVVSGRITEPGDHEPYLPNLPQVPLRSNEVEFQVVKADPEWQAEQLSAAVRVLDTATATSEETRHATRILRFLGSEESTRELARRYYGSNDQPFGWDLKFGLIGSPYRSIALATMKSALTDPQHPVTQELAQTLALMELASDPEQQLPPYDEKNKDEWVKHRDAHLKAFNRLVD